MSDDLIIVTKIVSPSVGVPLRENGRLIGYIHHSPEGPRVLQQQFSAHEEITLPNRRAVDRRRP